MEFDTYATTPVRASIPHPTQIKWKIKTPNYFPPQSFSYIPLPFLPPLYPLFNSPSIITASLSGGAAFIQHYYTVL